MIKTFEITIPTDSDGFALLQCPLCRELFKVMPADYNATDVIDIWCPYCGLKSKNYITDDIKELGMKKAQNFASDLIYNEMKKLEKQFNGRNISFKVGKKPRHQEELPIKRSIDNLEIIEYPCCKRKAKINSTCKLCGSYCPFCGVSYE